MTEEHNRTRRSTFPIATTNRTWIALRANSDLFGENFSRELQYSRLLLVNFFVVVCNNRRQVRWENCGYNGNVLARSRVLTNAIEFSR